MRRLFASLSALALLGGAVGCNHTAGICDCDPCNYSCCCTCAGMGYRSACGAYYGPTAPGGVPGLPAGAEVLPAPKKDEKKEDKKDDTKDEKKGGTSDKGDMLPSY